MQEEILSKKETLEFHNFSNIISGTNNYFKNIIFEFVYNDDNYKLMFHGKDSFIGFHISKNNKVDKNIPPYNLDSKKYEAEFIVNELNKSPIFNEMNEKTIYKINLINTSYENINVSIVPTNELVNFFIELIDRYYMPLYTVQENDTLSSICLKIYGNINYEKIIEYNSGMKLFNQYLVVRPNEKIRIKLE
jgi:hypothetical protein